MAEGLEYDPEIVHASVEVLRTPSARVSDFGESWARHGTAFRLYLAAVVEDLTHLPTTLDAIGAADTTALRDLPPPEPTPAPAAESPAEPTAESAAESTPESTPESGAEPVPDSEAEPASASGVESDVESPASDAEPTSESDTEQTSEQTPEQTPEPAAVEVPADDAWAIVGEPLDERVAAVAELELDLDPDPAAKRAELRGLHWGRIGEDVARLAELATVVDDIVGRIAHDSAAATLTTYATAVRAAATGLRSALAATHDRYRTYRDQTLDTHLSLDDQALTREQVDAWYRATDDLKSDVDELLAAALVTLRTIAEATPFTADRQLVATGRQLVVLGGGVDHLTVTVADGTGPATSYDLDFDAASGLTAEPAAPAGQADERVPAGTNGKCVFAHGAVTITAERSLFDATTITLTLDNGVDQPTIHTVAVPTAPAEPAEVVVPEQAGASDETAAAGIGWSVHGDLFDSRDPVHSVHGVLVLDDLGSR
ncbi:hypothetical protein [Actinophytocola sediminis]